MFLQPPTNEFANSVSRCILTTDACSFSNDSNRCVKPTINSYCNSIYTRCRTNIEHKSNTWRLARSFATPSSSSSLNRIDVGVTAMIFVFHMLFRNKSDYFYVFFTKISKCWRIREGNDANNYKNKQQTTKSKFKQTNKQKLCKTKTSFKARNVSASAAGVVPKHNNIKIHFFFKDREISNYQIVIMRLERVQQT